MLKAAILFFGQPRVCRPEDYFQRSLRRYCEANSEYTFDYYMHQWTAPPGEYQFSRWAGDSLQPDESSLTYLLEQYKPKRHLFEEQREFNMHEYLHPDTNVSGWHPTDISRMISQVYSLSQVCKIIENPEEYQWFIVVRVDSELMEHVPLLSTLSNDELHGFKDILQIFGINVLSIYQNLMTIIRETPSDGCVFDAELLRRYPIRAAGIAVQDTHGLAKILRRYNGDIIQVEDHLNDNSDLALITADGVYCRHVDDHLLLKFPLTGGKIKSQYEKLLVKTSGGPEELLCLKEGILEVTEESILEVKICHTSRHDM